MSTHHLTHVCLNVFKLLEVVCQGKGARACVAKHVLLPLQRTPGRERQTGRNGFVKGRGGNREP